MKYDIRSVIKMSNGVLIPRLGLGVWKVEDENEMKASCNAAFDAGYLHVDTASVYDNEDMVGRAIKERGNRKDIFLTTKLWNTDQANAEAAFELSLKKLQTDYVDLYLIHWPSPMNNNYVKAWKSLVEIYKSGRAKAIGVSNFGSNRIEEIIRETGFTPHMNQVERHLLYQQNELAKYCAEKNIALTAYSPLGNGKLSELAPSVKDIAEKQKKTAAQIILRWHLQTGWALIPKSVRPERVLENSQVYDFELDETDLKAISKIDCGRKFLPDPETAAF